MDLLFGGAVHTALEGKEENTDYLQLLEQSGDTTTPDGHLAAKEWTALFEGLTRTFQRYTRPQIEQEYDWIASELEMTMDIGDMHWMSRLDGVLRRKADGLYFVLEAKTSSWLQKLQNESTMNFQLLMECEALRRWLRDRWNASAGSRPQVGGALLLVFDKSERRRASAAEQARGLNGYRRLSPFTYCYSKTYASGRAEYALDYKSGWDRTPTWTIPGWYDILAETWPDVLRDTVQVWPSISFDEERVASVLRQVHHHEERVARYRKLVSENPLQAETLRDWYFSQNFAQCHNSGGFGRECKFKRCCFSPLVAQDPVATGEYKPREPNHPQEQS